MYGIALDLLISEVASAKKGTTVPCFSSFNMDLQSSHITGQKKMGEACLQAGIKRGDGCLKRGGRADCIYALGRLRRYYEKVFGVSGGDRSGRDKKES